MKLRYSRQQISNDLGLNLLGKGLGRKEGEDQPVNAPLFSYIPSAFFIALYLWEGSEPGPQDRGVPREHALPLGSWLGLPRGSGVPSDPFHISPADLPELNTHL